MATAIGPMRLPGDGVGGPADPFDRPLSPAVADRLYQWAEAHDARPGALVSWKVEAP
jgi:hypothetical protein